MTKTDIVDAIAEKTDLPKTKSKDALEALLDTVTESLKKGEKVTLTGFGTFRTYRRKARMGRNPQTGERIRIPAATVPKFKAGKNLKEEVKEE